MTAAEVPATFMALLDEVSAGEEIEITKHGRTVARLSPASGPQARPGALTGVAMTAASEQDLFSTGADWNLG